MQEYNLYPSSPFMGIGFEQKCLIVAPHYHILVHCSVTEWYHSLSHMLQPWPSLACTVYRASSMCVWMCESLSRTLVAVDGFIWAPLCVQKLHRVRNSDRSLLSPSLYSPSRHQSPSPLCPSCHYSSLCKRRCSKLTICTTAESFFSSFVLYMDTFFFILTADLILPPCCNRLAIKIKPLASEEGLFLHTRITFLLPPF